GSSSASAFTLFLSAGAGLIGQRIEAECVQHAIERRGDLVRDVIAATRVEPRLAQIDVPGRHLRRLADEPAERPDEGACEDDADDEREENAHDEHERRVEGRVVRRLRVGRERYGEDVPPGLGDEPRHDAPLLIGTCTERERRAAARALGERVERGLERRQGVDDQLVRRLLAKALVGDELLDGIGFDRRDRLVDQRFGLVAAAPGAVRAATRAPWSAKFCAYRTMSGSFATRTMSPSRLWR